MVRFDQPCLRVDGAVNYFREHLKVGEYLSEEGRQEMEWWGKGAARLELNGACTLAALAHLCAGRHPTAGEFLTPRDKGGKRRVCFFGQISAPKDVSIALLVGGDTRIAEWWRDAVAETLHEMEFAAATRVRRSGENGDRRTANVVAAIVTHETSRALDPQLHTHVCLLNLTYDEQEGRWKSLQPLAFFRHQGFFREVCYNRLAQRMRAGGYELEPQRGVGFTIKGVPARLRTEFSRRRAAILRVAEETGATTQDALQTITLATRAAKSRATARELRAAWEQRCGDDWAQLRRVIDGAMPRAVPPLELNAAGAIAAAAAHVFERQSVSHEQVLLRESLRLSRGYFSLQDLRAALQASVAAKSLLRVDENLASPEALADEREFILWASRGRCACPKLGEVPSDIPLEGEQAAAVAEVLHARSRVIILAGDAGTGKTTSLRAILKGIEQAGGRTFGCAPSATATEVLRRELSSHADTLQQVLVNPALQAKIRGAVLIVDEAGLVSGRQMRDLCRLAERNDHRLLLVGDTKQHTAVPAGDALRGLQEFALVPVVRLTQIRRQRNRWFRAAVALLARGWAAHAFDYFARLGAVREEREPARLFTAAAKDYVETSQRGETCLAISPVWSDIHRFTAAVRAELKATGQLGATESMVRSITPLSWTKVDRQHLPNYRAGDVLMFFRAGGGFSPGEVALVTHCEPRRLLVRSGSDTERAFDPKSHPDFEVGIVCDLPIARGERLLLRGNHAAAGLRNGELVEVAALWSDDALHLTDGRTIPPEFRLFTYGYATTSHAAQGKTVDRGILILAADGIAAANLKQAYVSNSRFRESHIIFTSDAAAARAAMTRPADRALVSELLPPDVSTAMAEPVPLGNRPQRAGARIRQVVASGRLTRTRIRANHGATNAR